MIPTGSDLIFGKYQILSRLAVGGMGEVFEARQVGVPGFERMVILKSLLPDLAKEQDFIAQFLDEARVAATLNHPNVVSIYEVGQWNGTYYIAMELHRRPERLGAVQGRQAGAGYSYPGGDPYHRRRSPGAGSRAPRAGHPRRADDHRASRHQPPEHHGPPRRRHQGRRLRHRSRRSP